VSTPAALAARYDLLVFAGHEEYVTPHAFDLVEGYRDRGGNLVFLSANNFLYRVFRSGSSITKTERWRDLGRPEASLVGIQYVDWFQNVYPNRPYVVTGVRRAPWLFRGTRLGDGDRFGLYGIEIDARTPASPPGTQVLATIPDAFGAGKTAEMTYYTSPRGAKVFAAGVLNFGGAALVPPTPRLLENLWARVSVP
jgi:N,N-dimethylformamidase beta subunit-like, C-terminal